MNKRIAIFTTLILTLGVKAVEASPKVFAFNFKPPTSGRPAITIGGAVRDQSICTADLNEKEPVFAFTANSSLTAASHPEFFASFPKLNGDKKATLIVRDSEESFYEKQEVQIPSQGGVVKFSLDKENKALVPGVQYEWLLQLHCGQTALVDDPTIHGQVTRITLEQSLPDSPDAKIKTLAANNLWYDTLATAYQLRESGQVNYWQELVDATKQN